MENLQDLIYLHQMNLIHIHMLENIDFSNEKGSVEFK